MKTIYIITIILLVIAVLLALIILFYKQFNEKINILNNRLNETENEYIEKIKNKYDIITNYIKTIKTKYKVDSKIFNDVEKIQIDNLSSIKNEKLLNKCYKELNQIKEDKQKAKELKCFRKIIDNYDENELEIISLRTYYNKYTLEYNNMIKKFPYNIISKIKKHQIKTLLEGKELETNFNNDLEV